MSKRVVRVICYEGNPDWVDRVLSTSLLKVGKTFFTKSGTISELQRVELVGDQALSIAAVEFGEKKVEL